MFIVAGGVGCCGVDGFVSLRAAPDLGHRDADSTSASATWQCTWTVDIGTGKPGRDFRSRQQIEVNIVGQSLQSNATARGVAKDIGTY